MLTDRPPLIFDRAALALRRARAARRFVPGSGVDFLASRTTEDLVDRLAVIQRPFDTVALLGAPTSSLADALRQSGRHQLVAEFDATPAVLRARSGPRVCSDEEALPLKTGAWDAVLSPLALQAVNDLPGTLLQIRQALRPDGLFLAAVVGGETLTELRQCFVAAESDMEGGASPRVYPFADGRDLAGLLQRAGFALPVVDSDRWTVSYATPLHLLADLRAMGATNVLVERRRSPLRRSTLMRAMDLYVQRHARADGKVLATFEVLTMTAWAPHESQQKPLQPGSAKARLADALKTREVPAGDKPDR